MDRTLESPASILFSCNSSSITPKHEEMVFMYLYQSGVLAGGDIREKNFEKKVDIAWDFHNSFRRIYSA
jgi:hypothetical protein